ncbi:MAG: Gfo/Idh/MocA family oxidoreductase [Spirochaetales bacterium]|nr:Gfo/Idh/MocA family oxidoreductase [Spirochaetales bacterium]
MEKITAVLVGAGDRGLNAYGNYAKNHPEEIQFVGVAELDDEKREKFKEVHDISDDMAFKDAKEMLSKERLADAVFICTNEKYHYEPAKLAMDKGYHILLEKPITIEPETSLEIGDMARDYDKTFMLGYVLRYTPFFYNLKKLIDEGKIGEVRSIQYTENVGVEHYSHSFVRGVFAKEAEAGPMLLSKSCHDMDIINWLMDGEVKEVSSYASESWFKEENAPADVPDRCTDGCPVSDECHFYAPRMYFRDNPGFSTSVISVEQTKEAKMEALRNGPFGRCVYKCDNDVVDEQVINFEFDNGVTVAFTMNGYTSACDRRVKIMGTEGELRGHFGKNEIKIDEFLTGNTETYDISTVQGRHGGGDYYLASDFVKMVRDQSGDNRTAVKNATMSHIMAFAAEKSRKEDTKINIEEYKDFLRK